MVETTVPAKQTNPLIPSWGTGSTSQREAKILHLKGHKWRYPLAGKRVQYGKSPVIFIGKSTLFFMGRFSSIAVNL